MSGNRLPSDRNDPKSDARQGNLALRWESATGEGRILAKGAEALALYQSDMVEGFRGGFGGFMALGRIQDDGSFRPVIRRAIPLPVAITAPVVPENGVIVVHGSAIARPDEKTIIDDAPFLAHIVPILDGQLDDGAELLA